jgi:hypothetical protein
MAPRFSLSGLGDRLQIGKPSKKNDLPRDTIGRVIRADDKTIVATVETDIELHRHYFVEVKAVGSDGGVGGTYLLIA